MDMAVKGDLHALGNAMHAAQDRWAPGHRSQEWHPPSDPAHILGDTFLDLDPIAAQHALDDTIKLARQFARAQCK